MIDEFSILNAKDRHGNSLTPEDVNRMWASREISGNLEFHSEYATAIVPHNVVCVYNKISVPVGGGKLLDATLIVTV